MNRCVFLILELLLVENQQVTKKAQPLVSWRVATIARPLAGSRQNKTHKNEYNFLNIIDL